MNIEHIGIAVNNLEEAIEKFQKICPDLHFHIEQSADGEMQIAFLKFDNVEIELLEPLKKESVIGKFIQKKGEGIHHIALDVKNISESMAKVKSTNIRLINDEPKKGSNESLVAFLHPKDFNGVLIELCQRKKKNNV